MIHHFEFSTTSPAVWLLFHVDAPVRAVRSGARVVHVRGAQLGGVRSEVGSSSAMVHGGPTEPTTEMEGAGGEELHVLAFGA